MIPVLNAAASAAGKPRGGALASFLPLILIFVVFYFLLIVPQNKRTKKHKDMINQLKVGDEVISSAGIYGKIRAIKDNTIDLQISDRTTIKILKNTISSKL